MKYIRDPLYGDVPVHGELLPIVDHPLFQKLRNKKQLSLAYLVYPSAVHTRFEHSLGVYYVTTHATEERSVWAYALLHDVGHAAFSHLMELALMRYDVDFDHEKRSERIAKEILQDSPFSFKEVWKNRENVLIYGGVGTDRLDYLQRDSYFTGVRVGHINWERIVRSMRVEGKRLVIQSKVLPNVEHLYVARFILGDAVYFHKTVLIADEMFVRAVGELLNHYSPSEIVEMDDHEIIVALRKINSYWWRRIEERRLFKMYFRGGEEEAREVYEKLASRYGEDAVILGRRPSFYSKPDVYLESGERLLDVSPLLRALRKSEETRRYWFVAVDPLRIPPP
ncbi:MAG: HD domain-containing protein [Candidatus Diapherotrites archaeon]|nr:HD domain-containing protein [Candidatus Diapherotrites archaeon]